MDLSAAMSTALTGMNAAQTDIDVVGNNLANADTMGFKSSMATFATQFLQTEAQGSAPTATNGGVNPSQVGLGSMVANIETNMSQGTIQTSSNPTDLAIQGDGFFIVQAGTGDQFYTRDGQFQLNSENQLVTNTGNRVLGFGVGTDYTVSSTTLQPLTIPLGSAAVAQATSTVTLQGTLSPTGGVANLGTILDTGSLSDGAISMPAATGGVAATPTPTVPTATGSTTAGSLTASGTYEYEIALVDSNGNIGALSPVSSPLTLAAGQTSIDLSGLPSIASLPAGAELNIYRTDSTGDASTFKLAATLTQSQFSSGSWTDTVADTALTGSTPTASGSLSGQYTYYMTFANGAGGPGHESNPTEIGTVNLANSSAILTDLPADTSGQWSERRIYRSVNNPPGNTNLYYVGSISNATSANATYIDGASDASLIANATANTAAPDILNFNNAPATGATLLSNLLSLQGTTYSNVFSGLTGSNTEKLSFTPQKGGNTLTTQSLTIDSTTTLQELTTFLTQAMGVQTGFPDASATGAVSGGSIDPTTGAIKIIGNYGSDNALDIGASSLQISGGSAGGTATVNLPFTATQQANGESAMTDFVAYDSLGNALNVHLTAVLQSTNSSETTYQWFADCPQNTTSATNSSIAVGSGTVSFDSSGKLLSTTNDQVAIYQNGMAAKSPETFTLDFSQVSGLSASSSSLSVSQQDGSAAGVLSSFNIDGNGTISGVFSNGVTRTLGQIQLARFTNEGGLVQQGQNMFSAGVNSGLPITANPGAQGLGQIVAGANELSNSDVGGSLIDLILASTVYQGNARVISTVEQCFTNLLTDIQTG